MRAPRDPRMGIDVAGVVESVGAERDPVPAGRPGLRGLVRVRAGRIRRVRVRTGDGRSPIPAGLSFEDAATLPALGDPRDPGAAAPRRSDGPARRHGPRSTAHPGNVGPFAVQIAKTLGAEVTGVRAPAKLDFVRSLGADHVLDYRRSTTRRPASATTGSSTPTPTTRSVRSGARCDRTACYVTLGGTAWPIVQGMIVGPLLSLFSDRWSGLMLWWKPFDPARRGDPHRPDRAPARSSR